MRLKKRIQIDVAHLKVVAELNETETAETIWQALPFSGEASLWGDEVYFPIPLSVELENGKAVVDMGDLGYWPPGNAFCIFFGKTPASYTEEIRPASAVNVFGKVLGDVSVFKVVKSGDKIVVKKKESQQ